MRRPYIVGNWKMHGTADALTTLADIAACADSVAKQVDVGIAPPATLLHRAVSSVGGSALALGGQDCHSEQHGAFTGDMSAEMLRDAGAEFVIIGHSERRSGHRETNADVRAKAAAAMAVGLGCILCIGEPLDVREAGEAEDYLAGQLAASLPNSFTPDMLTIAYEPIWAIGTGHRAGRDDIVAVHRLIRTVLTGAGGDGAAQRVLYGGSVNASNAADLFAADEIDGALVGGASLKAESFNAIIRAAAP